MIEKISNPETFIEQLGDLHDARIQRLEWGPKQKQFEITVNDIYSNFVGLPDYKGCQPKKLLFDNIRDINMSVSGAEDSLNIYEFVITKIKENHFGAHIKCWPQGEIKFLFSDLNLKDI